MIDGLSERAVSYAALGPVPSQGTRRMRTNYQERTLPRMATSKKAVCSSRHMLADLSIEGPV